MNASESEFRVRVQWALARVKETVNAGREAGWLVGRPIDAEDSDSTLDELPAPELMTPMRQVASRLGLRALDVDMLWMLGCIELAPEVAHASSMLALGTDYTSVQMIERLIARSGALDSDVIALLFELSLIETTLDRRVPLHRRPIRINDRVLDLMRGELALERSLRAFASLESEVDARRADGAFLGELPAELTSVVNSKRRCVAVALGLEGSGRATMLKRAIMSGGKCALVVSATQLSRDANERTVQLRSIARECKIHDALPILRHLDDAEEVMGAVEQELVSRTNGPVFATARVGMPSTRSVPVVAVSALSFSSDERRALWRRGLGGCEGRVIDLAACNYNITPGMIRHAAESAVVAAGGKPIGSMHVHQGVRAQLERALMGLGRRLQITQSWDDLVLPVEQFDLLIELVSRVRRRVQVLEQWGFATKVGRGVGTAALFSGPPGTGKTMIAGLLANELGLDLYQVDLSKLVSKYIGETEKQLSQVFDAAEGGHAILLFDEADSLFGKRTEIKGGNDRYANLEVNYLLQRMEAFTGVCVMTTNHETAIDQAFMRRLAFHVRVPMPEEREREQLWRAMLPAKAPVAPDLDVTRLARRFVMSGGYIRNAALRAAFMAAEEGTAISTQHLERAARLEYEGMGKIAA